MGMKNISVMKVFFIFLGVFLFGALAFTQPPPLLDEEKIFSGEAILRMTKDGFIPTTLRVTQGTVVRFVNEDEQFWHWPASDFHPTHMVYPEFDPHEALEPNQEWSFTFEEIGQWNMHDHLIPSIIGIIIVIE